MSVVSVSADFAGVDRLLTRADEPLDMRHARAELVEFYVNRETQQFERAPWRPLSRRYAVEKARKYPGRGVLQRTGALFEGLTLPEVAEFTRDRGVVGIRTGVGRSPLFYAQFAQQGRGEPRRTVMPGLRKDEREEIVDLIRVTVLRRVLHARP